MFLPTIPRCSFQSQPHVVCQLKNRGYEASDIKDDGSEEKLKTPANHLARVLTNLMSVMIVSSRSFSLHFFCPVPRQSRGHVFICVGGKDDDSGGDAAFSQSIQVTSFWCIHPHSPQSEEEMCSWHFTNTDDAKVFYAQNGGKCCRTRQRLFFSRGSLFILAILPSCHRAGINRL